MDGFVVYDWYRYTFNLGPIRKSKVAFSNMSRMQLREDELHHGRVCVCVLFLLRVFLNMEHIEKIHEHESSTPSKIINIRLINMFES